MKPKLRAMSLITVIWHGIGTNAAVFHGNDTRTDQREGPNLDDDDDGSPDGKILVDAGLTTVRKCPVGHFECATDNSLCVPQASICNSKADCPDNSDEQNCHNHHDKSFWDSLFYKRPGEEAEDMEVVTCQYKPGEIPRGTSGGEDKLKNTRKLSTSLSTVVVSPGKEANETLSSLSSAGKLAPPGAEEDWRSGGGNKEVEWEAACECFAEKLFCQNLHALNLSWLPRNVEFLDLSGSRVNLYEFTTLTWPKLESLILSNCFIEDIPTAGTFGKLNRLTTLHLTSNGLKSIPSGTFGNNRNLRTLFLGYNQLTYLQPDSFTGLTSLRELDLRHNRISTVQSSVFRPLKSLRKLHLNHNELKSIPADFSAELSGLEMLSLSANSIEHIYAGAFENMTSLKGLFLSWNRLTVLSDGIFCNLRSLLNLNLKDNQIVHIDTEAFACLEQLESLNLEKNRFGELQEPQLIFANLSKLRHVYFEQFWMCWWAPHVRFCEPKGDGISSVDNLLDNIILRTCVWIMGLIGVGGNLFVIVSRMVLREPNRVHSFYIKNLAFADLLMGVFLLSIAAHDVKFRGEFLSRQHSWRHSLTCQFSGMISTVSSEASVLILTLITFDRYLSIARPFAAERSRASFIPALTIVTILWVLSSALSYVPLSGLFLDFFGADFYSTNGLCLPLNIHNPYDPAWEYSFVLFVVINSSAFTFICYAYWKMLRIIQSSSLTIRSTQQKQDTLLAKRFGLVVLTDFLCWAPVIISKTLAMSGVQVPSTMYAWLAVFVLPVNSALNPILYTMTTKLFKQQMSKLTMGFTKKMRRHGRLDESTASGSVFWRNRSQRTLTSSFGSSLRHSSVKNSVRRTLTRNSIQVAHRSSIISPYGNGNGVILSGIPTVTNNSNGTTFQAPTTTTTMNNMMNSSICHDAVVGARPLTLDTEA